MSSNTLRTYVRYAAVGATVDITINPEYNQVFAGCKYYSDNTYLDGAAVTPSAGTIAITGRPNGLGAYGNLDNSLIADNPLDATSPGDVLTTNTPLDALKFVPTGITGATNYRITVTAKKT